MDVRRSSPLNVIMLFPHRASCVSWVVVLLNVGVVATSAWVPSQRAVAQACAAGREPTADGYCCWPGQSFSLERRSCEGPPRCPAGYLAVGVECEWSANGVSEEASPPERTTRGASTAPQLTVALAHENADDRSLHLFWSEPGSRGADRWHLACALPCSWAFARASVSLGVASSENGRVTPTGTHDARPGQARVRFVDRRKERIAGAVVWILGALTGLAGIVLGSVGTVEGRDWPNALYVVGGMVLFVAGFTVGPGLTFHGDTAALHFD